ncbi:MAG: zinc-ribbon domain-containing protein [Rhodobacteraceae bacterium]|nr:zinc-ribbon domain-containing protein [Paracoccaceae bacterium]
MRLICPNCDAQYEVPNEVIPSEGRDVQCSNCGDTWFQTHVDPADSVEFDPELPPEHAASDDEPSQDPMPAQVDLESSVKDILREEAELEAQIRAEESGNTLESQTDLGLDDLADESERRAQEAQDRMDRIRGTEPTPDTTAKADRISIPESRRGMLPDIEEINSTLDADSDKPDANTAVGPALVKAETKTKHKNNFTRGFAAAIIIAIVMATVYVNAPRIAQRFPQADPALNSYVTGVASLRLWIDTKIGDLIPDTGN